MIIALLFAAAVIAARIYGTVEFARADESLVRTHPTWRAALARSL